GMNQVLYCQNLDSAKILNLVWYLRFLQNARNSPNFFFTFLDLKLISAKSVYKFICDEHDNNRPLITLHYFVIVYGSLCFLMVNIMVVLGIETASIEECEKCITPGKDGKPVQIQLTDAKTKEYKETLEVDAALIATGRAPFTKGLGLENVHNFYCIGDAIGKMMLAHAASEQGISVVERVTSRDHLLNHLSIPAACFTHPEISFVGYTEPQAREKAQKEKFEIRIAKTSFKSNTKALAEKEGEGLAKIIRLCYSPDNGEILGVHIAGMHAADLIHEASNAIALGTRIQDIKYDVHVLPALSEVLDELFESAHSTSQLLEYQIIH
ncbi:hypothetical protein MKW94_028965, partial [Papaver nudicaule]|nr:hypothetical protein [Papaver nudicaule]